LTTQVIALLHAQAILSGRSTLIGNAAETFNSGVFQEDEPTTNLLNSNVVENVFTEDAVTSNTFP
jgi:hypothetical protein